MYVLLLHLDRVLLFVIDHAKDIFWKKSQPRVMIISHPVHVRGYGKNEEREGHKKLSHHDGKGML